MKSLLLVIALVALALGEEPQRYYHESAGIAEAARILQAEQALDFDGARIIGGTPAALGAYPYLGGLVITLTTGEVSVCGSSLLTNTRSVTAAHCWWDGRHQARQFLIVHGSTLLFSGGVRTTTSNVEMHANWNTENFNNDVAIITHNWVSYNNVISNVQLPSGSLLNNNFAGQFAQAAGFGKTSDSASITFDQYLRHAWMQVITNAVCAQTYGTTVVIDSTLCISGTSFISTCSGDSGGPLVINSGGPVLIGIGSFISDRGCSVAQPAAFARVTSFTSWIQQRI